MSRCMRVARRSQFPRPDVPVRAERRGQNRRSRSATAAGSTRIRRRSRPPQKECGSSFGGAEAVPARARAALLTRSNLRSAPSARTARRPRAWPPRGARSHGRCASGSTTRPDRQLVLDRLQERLGLLDLVLESLLLARVGGPTSTSPSPGLGCLGSLEQPWPAWPARASPRPAARAPPGPARTLASRRRSCAASGPRSPPCAARPHRAARGRARPAAASPVNSLSASSSASRLSRSRWLVGSSRISTFAPDCTRIASDRRRRSPPERTSSGFSASSPENRKRPSRAPGLVRGELGQVRGGLEHRARGARRRAPRRAGRESPALRCVPS